jgi:hypothetical protein
MSIPLSNVLVNLIVQIFNVDMIVEFCEQIFLWSQGLTNDSHNEIPSIVDAHEFSFINWEHCFMCGTCKDNLKG